MLFSWHEIHNIISPRDPIYFVKRDMCDCLNMCKYLPDGKLLDVGTGGGIPGNLPRCLPKGMTVDVDYDSWERPEIFNVIQKEGDIEEEEMRKTFNLGIGFCLIVPPDTSIDTEVKIWGHDLKSWVIGQTK